MTQDLTNHQDMASPAGLTGLGNRQFSATRYIGLIGLASLVIGTAIVSSREQSHLATHFEVPFGRGINESDGADAAIAAAASFLKAYPHYKVQIIGYTETAPTGSNDSAANVTLASQRAATVKEALVAQGISAERMAAYGAGGVDPPPRRTEETDAAYQRRQARAVIQVEKP